MANEIDLEIGRDETMTYAIKVEGHLDAQWTDWFGGLSIRMEEDGNTLITGAAIDQATLHSVLKRVRDLGMTLVSVAQVKPEGPSMPGPID